GVLGEGGMGVVLEGHDPRLNRRVAIKILRPELAHDPVALARFEREAKAAGALQHPNVLTVYGVGQIRGVHYIVMECVRGLSLAQLIAQSGPLPAELAREIFRQMLAGLAAAHDAGLIHRDIKSSNILLAGEQLSAFNHQLSALCPQVPDADALPLVDGSMGFDSQEVPGGDLCCSSVPSSLHPFVPSSSSLSSLSVKLADFGIARMLSSHTQLTVGDSILGTPEYMSPEQARGDADIDHRTDLYSAGVVLYEMLTGRTPFKAETPTATIRRILDDDAPDPRQVVAGVDACLASVAMRLMSKESGRRFASVAQTKAALDHGRAVRTGARRRRVVRSALLKGALTVAAILIVLTAAWNLLPEPRPGRVVQAAYVDPDVNRDKHYLKVRYEGASDFEIFDDEDELYGSATVADVDADGHPDVVVGLRYPQDEQNLIAFDADGERIRSWGQFVGDRDNLPWPDPKTTDADLVMWGCLLLALDDVDGDGHPEIVAVASEHSSQETCLSVIDARTREIRSTFWHIGNIDGFIVCPDLLSDGSDRRPAIVAWGCNNALDDFRDQPTYDPTRPDPQTTDDDKLADEYPYQTRYDFVPVVMILDPLNMSGLGPIAPPREKWSKPRQHLPQFAHLPAYAYLDVPVSQMATYIENAVEINPPKVDAYKIQAVVDMRRSIADDLTPVVLKVVITPTYPTMKSGEPIAIFVDEHLQPTPPDARSVTLTAGNPAVRDKNYWLARWRLIQPADGPSRPGARETP
ncbi:MAG: serine/threonine protein kinase, partial [Phycisphaerae bacterium]|nr:serine/threonine protein kinase [Phycisphaerae bacterium]